MKTELCKHLTHWIYRFLISACNCYTHGIYHGVLYTKCSTLGNNTRKCDCKAGYIGEFCNECDYDYYDSDNTSRINCSGNTI